MRPTLRQLKESKGQYTQFPFLRKVSDYIKEEYKELIPSLTAPMYKEILEEIIEDIKSPLITYKTFTTLQQSTGLSDIHYTNLLYDEDKEKETVELIQACLSASPLFKSKNRNEVKYKNELYKLDEIYYVTDMEAFQVYLDGLRADEHDKMIAELNKKEEERVAKELEDRKLQTKYGIESQGDLALARNIENLNHEDPKERFKAFKGLADSQCTSDDYVREIAYSVALDVVDDHNWDRH